jgi:Tfp pilus assembly protein PilF
MSHAGDSRGGRGGWRAWAPWALVALAALLPYLNTLGCGFAFDDGAIILENPTLARSAPWWQGLAEGFWPGRPQNGLYRPVTALTFRLQRGPGEDAAAGFHAVNLLLHVGVCLLSYALLLRLLGPRRGAALAIAVLFAVHPIHTEAVSYIQGRAELLAALAGLGGYFLWLFGRGRVTPSAIGLLFALAAGSKESAVGWGLLLAAHRAGLLADGRGYRALRAQGPGALRRALGRDAAAVAGFAAYLLARRVVLGSFLGLGDVDPIDNPLFAAPWPTRVLTALAVAARGLGLTLWPRHLSADYSFDAIPLTRSPLGPSGLLALALAAGIAAAFRLRRRAPIPAWSVAAWASLLLPVSNLLFPIGTIMAERLWYLPSLGAIALLVWVGRAGVARFRSARAAVGIVLVVALLLAARTVVRNRDWTDDRTLFRAAVAAQPRSVKAHVNLASRLMTTGTAADMAEAERHYRAAQAIAPDYLPVLNGLGYLYTRQRSYDAARALLQEAIAKQPGQPEAWVRLGNLELEVGRGAEALAAFEGALRAAPDLTEAWIGKASALFLLARYDASADTWIEAQRRAGSHMDLRAHAAAACARAGRIDAAEALLRERVAAHPGDPAVVRPLLRFLLARGDCDAARDLLSSSAALALETGSGAALVDSVNAACR